MKNIFKILLKYYFKSITKIVLLIHRPYIIAITGSTNKTFAKDEINKILREKKFSVRSNIKSFNTAIGLPLAILNLPSGYNQYLDWLPAILKAPLIIFDFNFPKFLVLELGISNPGDMKYLLSLICPKIAIITDITQRYLDAFGSMTKLVGEYRYFVKKINKKGLVILNYDNIKIRELANISPAPVIFFGTSKEADWSGELISHNEKGQLVKIKNKEKIFEYLINRHGDHHIYSVLISLIIKDYVAQKI